MPNSSHRKAREKSLKATRDALTLEWAERNAKRRKFQIDTAECLRQHVVEHLDELGRSALNDVVSLRKRAEAFDPRDRSFAKQADVVETELRWLADRLGFREFPRSGPGDGGPGPTEQPGVLTGLESGLAGRAQVALDDPDVIIGRVVGVPAARSAFHRRGEQVAYGSLAHALVLRARPVQPPAVVPVNVPVAVPVPVPVPVAVPAVPPAPEPLDAKPYPGTVRGEADGERIETDEWTTVTATGGVLPYSYAWASADPSLPVRAIAPYSETTAFEARGVEPGAQLQVGFTCTVRDAVGREKKAEVTAEFQRSGKPVVKRNGDGKRNNTGGPG